MKKIVPILTFIIIVENIVIIFLSMSNSKQMVVLKEGNTTQTPLEIILEKYQDSDCGMIIDSLEYASQVVASDGKTWFFHDHGGMANWLNNKDFKNSVKIFVMTKDTNRYIDGKTAFYSTNEITPMRYGFGTYENNQDGIIDFEEMSLRILRKQTLANPQHKEHKH